ncbi:hypothetical protein Hanom_Chr09g00766221 [Helianthus anomalus]
MPVNNSHQGGTTCFAEVVKDLKHACGGDSSEDENSSGYNGCSDEESSSSYEDVMDEVSRETIDVDVEKFLGEAKAVNDRRSIFVDQAAYSSSSSHRSAFMANVGGSLDQVCVDQPKSDKCDSYVDLGAKFTDLQSKYDYLQSRYDLTFIHLSNTMICKI